jgi:hypothetical protein
VNTHQTLHIEAPHRNSFIPLSDLMSLTTSHSTNGTHCRDGSPHGMLTGSAHSKERPNITEHAGSRVISAKLLSETNRAPILQLLTVCKKSIPGTSFSKMDSFEKNNELIWSEMIGNLSICL